MQLKPNIRGISPENASSLLIAIIFSTLLAFKVKNIFHLRPVADDYCFAASLNDGFVHSLIYWYQSVQFDFLVLVSNLVFVGIPIRAFSPMVASLFSFLFMLIVFSYFTVRQLNSQTQFRKSFSSIKIFLFSLSALLTYFWFQPSILNFLNSTSSVRDGFLGSALSRITQHSLDVTNSWTLWGVVNSSYLVPFLFCFWYIQKVSGRSGHLGLIYILFGVLIGTSGYVIASSTLATIILLQFLGSTNVKPRMQNFHLWVQRNSFYEILPVVASILVGAGISFFSPGGVERRIALKNLPQSAQGTFESLFDDAVRLFAEVFLNIGNITTVLFGYFIGIIIHKSSLVDFDRIKKILTVASLYLFSCFFLTLASEFFSYRAYWHAFTLKFDLFILLMALGIQLTKLGLLSNMKMSLIVCAVPVFVACSLMGLTSQIEHRYEAWRINVNYGAISSLGDKASWVHECYLQLRSTNPSKYYPEVN